MRGLALVVGNANYEKAENNLKNPINDANAFSDILSRLGYIVKCVTDINQQDLNSEIDDFGKKLNDYDVGIFYFAGHGMQIDGDNFMTVTNTAFDTEVSAQYSSVTLNKVLAYMERASNETNIVILDACRDNPFERSWDRSLSLQGLAPMYAPKGTLIAYATSPGERAKDGAGENGLYTSALLKHIQDKNITIEEFFKRVRNSVYTFSNGKQTSWEHTSLTGTFIFNSGQLVQSTNAPYPDEAIADKNFDLSSSNQLIDIVKELKVSNWYVQNPAMEKVVELNVDDYTDVELFILGRNILQTANGGENEAGEFMNDLANRLNQFTKNGINHVLNGLLFETYFNSDGVFRGKYLKTSYLPSLSALSGNANYSKSYDFIEEQLEIFRENMFYIPNSKNQTVNFDVVFEKQQKDGVPIFRVLDIKHEIKSVLVKDSENSFFNSGDDIFYETMQFAGLKSKISQISLVPVNKVVIATNFDSEINDFSKIDFPIGFKISKNN